MRILSRAGVGLKSSSLPPIMPFILARLLAVAALVVVSLVVTFVAPNAISTAEAAPKAKLIQHWEPFDSSSEIVLDHSPWQAILDKYLNDQHASGVNRFDYQGIGDEGFEAIKSYVSSLEQIDPSTLNRNEQFAFWVNLYNAKTVELVSRAVQRRRISSVRQIRSNYFWPGPWSMNTLSVNGKSMSLDDVEHGVLRPIWQDHRIHFAVNCASVGCPNLLKTAYTSSNFEELMGKAEQQFLAHPRGLRLDGGVLIASKIFHWYRVDFAADEAQLLNYFKGFIDVGDAGQELKIEYQYDWALNSDD